jgi:hypothetical protein
VIFPVRLAQKLNFDALDARFAKAQMQDKNAFDERKRGMEEEYFRKKEQDLVARMRRQGELEAERQRMAEVIGVSDQDVLRDLQELGYTPDTVMLLHLAPLVQVAWAGGNVTRRERELIIGMARSRGIEEGSRADQQLTNWLDRQPSDEFFQSALRIIRAMLQAMPPEEREASKHDLVSHCASIAAVSGGVLGFGKISNAEQKLLERIATEPDCSAAASST